MQKVKSQKYWTPKKIQNAKSLIKWQNQILKTHQTNGQQMFFNQKKK